MRHIMTLFDLTSDEIERIFAVTADLKDKYQKGLREPLLPGRTLALLFEKQSLRTRVSFEAAMQHLGGGSLFLGADVGWGSRETSADFGQVLGQYVDVIVSRGAHAKVQDLANFATCPVINGLTEQSHPCQGLTDLFTVREQHGKREDLRVGYVGDANNVARSLAVGCGKLGIGFNIAAPDGYQFEDEFVAKLKQEIPNIDLRQTTDPHEAVQDAQAVYTDVWASMGQEQEQAAREQALAPYQVNAKLMASAPADSIFLHCLPAKRGQEVTDEVIDGPQSQVLAQAENRMHAQKGLLAWLLGTQV